MVARGRSLIWGDVPKSLVSLNLGIIASIVSFLVLTNLILNPIDLSSEMTLEVQDRITSLLIWLVAGFGLGMMSWMVGFIAFPTDKSQPRWRTCRICSSLGIGFGILAILIYLVFMLFIPVPAYYPFLR